MVVQALLHAVNPAPGDRDTSKPPRYFRRGGSGSGRAGRSLCRSHPGRGQQEPAGVGWRFSGAGIGRLRVMEPILELLPK